MKDIIIQFVKKEKRYVCLLFIVTLALRAIYVYFTYNKSGTSNWGDDFYYLSIGTQFAKGNWNPMIDGQPIMNVGPFIPVLVAGFIWLFNNPVVPFFIYNILVSSLLVPVLYYLGKELFGIKTGLLLAFWGILNLEFFKYTNHVLKETTIYLLVPLALLFIILYFKNDQNLKYLVLTSFTVSLLIQTDERFLFYFPIMVIAFCFIKPFIFQKALYSISIFISLNFLVMIPWGIHNYKVYDQIVLVTPRTTSFTSKLWGKDISGISLFMNSKISNIEHQAYPGKNKQTEEEKANSFSTAKGMRLYTKTFINIWQPSYFKAKYIQYSWWPEPRIQKWSFRHSLTSIIFYGIFLPFYFFGLILLFVRSNYSGFFVGLIPIVHSLLHTFLVMPEERYRYPIVFIIVMIGFWTATTLVKRTSLRTIFKF